LLYRLSYRPHCVTRLNIYLIKLGNYAKVSHIMPI